MARKQLPSWPTALPQPPQEVNPTEIPDPTNPPTPQPTNTPKAAQVTLYVDAADQGYTGANVRARPSVKSERVGYIANGEAVEAVKQPLMRNGEQWHQVRYREQDAYVLGSLLNSKKPKPTPSPPPDTAAPDETLDTEDSASPMDMMYVDAGPAGYTGVKIRTRPNSAAPEIGGMDNGKQIGITAYSDLVESQGELWQGVLYKGKKGYVRADLLSFDPPIDTSAADVENTPPTSTATPPGTQRGATESDLLVTYYVQPSDYISKFAHLRSRPEIGAPSVARVPLGTVLEVPVDDIERGGRYWHEVQYKGNKGYMDGMDLNTYPPEGVLDAMYVSLEIYGLRGYRVRERPSLDSPVKAFVPNGTRLRLNKGDPIDGGAHLWYQTEYKGETVYIRKDALSDLKPWGNTEPFYNNPDPEDFDRSSGDLDCSDVSGPISVGSSDPHGLDGDGDGVGCE